MSQSVSEIIASAVAAVREKTDLVPEVALILGSGLGSLADEVQDAVEIPFTDIPGFAASTVKGHAGALVLGYLEGVPVGVLRGRVHYYEGYPMSRIILPLRMLHALGAKTLLVTNAAGGLSPKLNVGSLMLISDHINFMGTNPLIGPNDEELGPRFPPMSQAYSTELRELAKKVAEEQNIPVEEGVYFAVTGPSYETPAEIRMFTMMGGDAVGMSTVPEVIAAVHCGMRVLGISCITNILHKGPSKDNHESVCKAAAEAHPRFVGLVKGVLRHLK